MRGPLTGASNVIMGSPARLIDLSVARPEVDARRLRHPIGTDAYMAPEQCDPGAQNPALVPSYACLRTDPAARPLPADVSDALQPVLERLPRGSLAAFKVRG